MTYTPRTTEYAARETLSGLMEQVYDLIVPENDNNRPAWDSAQNKLMEAVKVVQVVLDAQAARPCLNPGLQALRAVATDPTFSDEPFQEQIRQTVEARRIPVETPQEAEALDAVESRQVEAAKPEVFNITAWAGNFFGVGKGA